MAVAGDVTRLPQDGAHMPKLHPHLVALVKWCASCAWGLAAVLLRRLLELPPAVPPLPALPPIAALVRSTLHFNASRRGAPPARTSVDRTSRAASPHISAVPTVECEVLYQPPGDIGVDIIFVHGLYGSLSNTWRQGRWRTKHKSELNKIPLKRPSDASETPCSCIHADPMKLSSKRAKKLPQDETTCLCDSTIPKNNNLNIHKDKSVIRDECGKQEEGDIKSNNNGDDENKLECWLRMNNNENSTHMMESQEICKAELKTVNSCDNLENTASDSGRQYILSKIDVIDNYDDFINEIFKNETNNQYTIDINSCDEVDMMFAKIRNDRANCETGNDDSTCDIYNSKRSTNNYDNDENVMKDECFSCKRDFTESVEPSNHCHEKASEENDKLKYSSCSNFYNLPHQCSDCTKIFPQENSSDTCSDDNIPHQCSNCTKTLYPDSSSNTCDEICRRCSQFHNKPHECSDCNNKLVQESSSKTCEVGCGCVCSRCYSDCWPRDWLQVDYPDARIISINYTSDPYLWRPIWIKESKRLRLHERAEQMMAQLLALGVGARPVVWVGHSKGGLFIKQIYSEAYEAYTDTSSAATANSANVAAAVSCDSDRSSLWSSTAGFMFYSVPHRGSPLADISMPPLVARSIELLEMGQDCSEVVRLQARWLRAAGGAAPVVRSLVETCRTLMAVLWLRIVSVESADAGIGALCGVSVDHREICKPSGRACLLYRELLALIDAALRPPHCRCR